MQEKLEHLFDKIHDTFIDFSTKQKFLVIAGIVYVILMVIFIPKIFIGDDEEELEAERVVEEENAENHRVSIGEDESKYNSGNSSDIESGKHSSRKIINGKLVKESEVDKEDDDSVDEYVSKFERFRTHSEEQNDEIIKDVEGRYGLEEKAKDYIYAKYKKFPENINDMDIDGDSSDYYYNLKKDSDNFESLVKNSVVKTLAEDMIEKAYVPEDEVGRYETDLRLFELTDGSEEGDKIVNATVRYKYKITPISVDDKVKDDSGVKNVKMTFVLLDGQYRISEVEEK